ncbi:MAG: hypothetical protein U5L98_05030 [Halomonas sp.]|uniref:hypothetical protein n=1 Tax=Halomonas sp. TaxID=1486246 RepID=UPI002ACE7AA9|nr:hypothetical protein [Halomonas sp.]MDZ7852017.1 hypothetical protein [Halomonas sp.]
MAPSCRWITRPASKLIRILDDLLTQPDDGYRDAIALLQEHGEIQEGMMAG